MKDNIETSNIREALKELVEKKCGKALVSPGDFVELVSLIQKAKIGHVSLSSVKRFWGYVSYPHSFRQETLSIFSRFVGYKDWTDFCESYRREHVESEFFSEQMIQGVDLEVGDKLELGWRPDRCCVVEYLGENTYKVVKAERCKLKVGDTFKTGMFCIGQALLATNLDRGDGHKKCYIAGRDYGLTLLRKL